jgi:SAM-dependent methyltransferase
MTPGTEAAHRFGDGDAYERFMGRWSRAAAPVFLRWVAAKQGLRWLDVGCGTGILSATVLGSAQPASIDAIDLAFEQLQHAASKRGGVRFVIADAQALPFRASSFDVVASALALNFIPDPARALREMHRVARYGATVAAFVWDFASERSPSWPLRRGMRAIGARLPDVPGTRDSKLESLQSLFSHAGLGDVMTLQFEVQLSYPNFEEFWMAQTPRYSPTTAAIAVLAEADRARLRASIMQLLGVEASEPLNYSATANAIRATAVHRAMH